MFLKIMHPRVKSLIIEVLKLQENEYKKNRRNLIVSILAYLKSIRTTMKASRQTANYNQIRRKARDKLLLLKIRKKERTYLPKKKSLTRNKKF